MIFETLVVGPLGVNCFILGCGESGEGVVIDPGGDVERILAVTQKLKLAIKYIINTHGHFDHVGGNAAIKQATGAELLIHEADLPYLSRAAASATMYGMSAENSPTPDRFLTDGLKLSFGRCELEVLHTPGHTPGGCCLNLATVGKVITGDTLFAESIGRTDLTGGSTDTLLASIRTKLLTLPDSTEAFPGHGPSTTIGHERQNNPYL